MKKSFKNFNALIDRSHEIPVVVQFFATWCGPCRILKPVMSEVASRSKGNWILAMMDVEKQPGIAAQYGVRSIPDVKMFYKGEIIAGFTGSKASYIIENWLENNLPKKRKKVKHAETLNLVKQGNLEGATLDLLKKLQENNSNSPIVKLLLAIQHVGSNNPEAIQQINKIDRRGEWGKVAKEIRDLIDIEIDKKDEHTPTSSPFNPSATSANEKIDIQNFDPKLLELLVQELINEVRKEKNAVALQPDSILTAAANDQNAYQIKYDVLSHYQKSRSKKTVMDRVNSFGGGFRSVGENVQYQGMQIRQWGNKKEIITDTYLNTALKIVENWVNSPGHYKNLINPKFTFVGTSVGWNPENFSIFSTQVFGS